MPKCYNVLLLYYEKCYSGTKRPKNISPIEVKNIFCSFQRYKTTSITNKIATQRLRLDTLN